MCSVCGVGMVWCVHQCVRTCKDARLEGLPSQGCRVGLCNGIRMEGRKGVPSHCTHFGVL